MARGNETTTKFKVDISELKKAMQEARKQVAYANSEFKEASSSMDDWSKSSDGISAKLKQLNSNLESQEKVLAEYEKALEEVKKEYGENSAEALEWATKLNNQKATVNKTKKEIAGYETALEEVSDAEKTAAKTGKTVEEVLKDVGDEAEDAEDGFTTLKGAIATFAGNTLSSLVDGLKDAVGNFISLSDETREYRNQMNKLNTAGAEAGYAADYVNEKYRDLYGVLADETATSTTISNFMALGAEEETLNSLLNSSIGIWAKYGDSIPLDGLAESINETSKVGAVTGNLADALNWAGISEDEFNEKLADCTTEQERQNLIADTLNDTYGDLSKSYQESNENIIAANKANADYTDTVADMGAAIEPVTTTLKEGFTGLLQELLKLVDGVDMEAFSAKIEEAFAVIKDDVLPAIKNGLGWIIDNKDIIIAGLAGIAAGFVAFKVASIIQGVTKAMQGMTLAQYALNLAMNLNPIGIVIALIAGLVAGIITLWNNSEAFRNFFIELWENIKNTVGTVVDAIVTFFVGLWDKIVEIMTPIVEFFSGIFQSVYNFISTTVTNIANTVRGLWTSITNTFSNAFNWFKTKVIDPIANVFSTMWNGLKNGASQAWAGVKSIFSAVTTFFSDIFGKAWQGVKDVFSTGGAIFVGIKDGIVSAFKTVVNGIIGGINKVIAVPFNAINGILSTIKNIDIMGLKPFDWISTFNVPQLPYLERGGILKKGQVGLLEGKGSEAVIPLERNLGWIRNIAKQLSVELGVNNGSALNGTTRVGGTVNNFYQTINSPKQLSRLDIYRQSKNLLNYNAGGGV